MTDPESPKVDHCPNPEWCNVCDETRPATPEGGELVEDRYIDVQEAIDGLDEERQRIMLLRLAAKHNNGSEHFDHSPQGASWLCLACDTKAASDTYNQWVRTERERLRLERELAEARDTREVLFEGNGRNLAAWAAVRLIEHKADRVVVLRATAKEDSNDG